MIERILYNHERDQIYEDLHSYTQINKGVQCWSLRRISIIFDVPYSDLLHDLNTLSRNLVQAGNRAGYSLSKPEFNALIDRRAKQFIHNIEVEAQLTGGGFTEIDDVLINSYMLYCLVDNLVYDTTDIQRMKDFVVLETAQVFPTFEENSDEE